MYHLDLELILSGGMIGIFSEGAEASRIYFLIKSNRVVYVGQTLNLEARMKQHCSKDFDNIAFIEVASEDANNVEAYYIVKWNPIYNMTISSNTLFKTLRTMSKEITRHINKNIHAYFSGDIVRYKSKSIDKRTGSVTMYVDNDMANKIIEKCCNAADKALYEAINSFNEINKKE